MRGVSQMRLRGDPDGLWHVEANVDGRSTCLRARWLIDATGRRASVARQNRSVPRACSMNSSPRWTSELGDSNPRCRTPVGGVRAGRMVVFRGGSGGSLVAVYVTDSDLRPGPERNPGRIWTAALESTEHTRQRVLGAKLAAPISVHGAQSTFLTPARGSGSIAIGDAAWSSDPLAGIGVSEALQSARSAARAVDAACSGDDVVLSAYVEALNHRVNAVLAQLLQAYRQEVRWADRRFWRRRQCTGSNRADHPASRRARSSVAVVVAETPSPGNCSSARGHAAYTRSHAASRGERDPGVHRALTDRGRRPRCAHCRRWRTSSL